MKATPFVPPPVEVFNRLLWPLRAYFAPKVFGLEHVDAGKPALYVANHSIYGLIDVSVFAGELYRAKGVYLRGLADSLHFLVPAWGGLLSQLGAVVGTRENCAALMEDRQHVLVFPGGGREVCRRKGEQYELLWKNRVGFARMAIRYGYPIVPFAQVGADDAYNIWVDANDILRTPIGRVLDATGILDRYLRGGDAIFPIARGLGMTLIPRPERFYFSLAAPIETTTLAGLENDDQVVYRLRDQVRDTIRDQIARLREYRRDDSEVGFVRRMLNRWG